MYRTPASEPEEPEEPGLSLESRLPWLAAAALLAAGLLFAGWLERTRDAELVRVVPADMTAALTHEPPALWGQAGDDFLPPLPKDPDPSSPGGPAPARTEVSMGGVLPANAPSPHAKVLAIARGQARHCYQSELGAHPQMAGRVSFSLRVGADGHVLAATVTPAGNLVAPVVTCIKQSLLGLEFEPSSLDLDPSTKTPATVASSFTFVNASLGR